VLWTVNEHTATTDPGTATCPATSCSAATCPATTTHVRPNSGKGNHAVLDYNNNLATKIYKGAVRALTPEFDVDVEGLNTFMAALYSKSREYGWDHILEVPRDLQAPMMDLTNYGELTLEHLVLYPPDQNQWCGP
jgi:hypothetical protein